VHRQISLTTNQASLILAGLFPNLILFESLVSGWTVGRHPYKLLVFAAGTSALVALAFYLSWRAAMLDNSSLRAQHKTTLGRAEAVVLAAYLLALSSLTVRLAVGAYGYYRNIFTDPAGPGFYGPDPTFGVLWLIWSVLAVSGGFPGLARSNRFWAPASLAMATGVAVSFWRQIATWIVHPLERVGWTESDAVLGPVLGYGLPLALVPTLLAARTIVGAKPAQIVMRGVALPLFGTIVLIALALAGSSLRTSEILGFWYVARNATSPMSEAKLVLVTLTLLPIARLAALTLIQLFGPLGPRAPWLAAALLIAVPALRLDGGGNGFDEPLLLWSGFLACILAGAKAGAFLTKKLLSRDAGRTGEWAGVGFGLFIGLGLASFGVFKLGSEYMIFRLFGWPGGSSAIYFWAYLASLLGTIWSAPPPKARQAAGLE